MIVFLEALIPEAKFDHLESAVDEETYQLAADIYMKLADKLRLISQEIEAYSRLKNSFDKGKSMQSDLHRNNIFKAAHVLGMKLPSSSF